MAGGPLATGARRQAPLQFGCGQRIPTSCVLERSSHAPGQHRKDRSMPLRGKQYDAPLTRPTEQAKGLKR